MTPVFHVCSHRCNWCWRDIDFTQKEWSGPVDDPKDIIDGCIEAQKEYLIGFGGNKNADKEALEQAMNPLHFAISLSGEPTFYPRLPELIQELNKRNITSFLVTNGTNPEAIKKLKDTSLTQFYLTLPAPDKETYTKVCNPLIKDGWQRILESLKLMKELKCRKAIRLTLVKGENMFKPEKYAKLIKDIDFDFLECKAYVWVGHSRDKLNIEAMPFHEDIVEFAKEIIKYFPELKIIDQKKESRVVLLAKQNKIDRILKF
jgi:tRNA wybutosine-synthesizing protein 1